MGVKDVLLLYIIKGNWKLKGWKNISLSCVLSYCGNRVWTMGAALHLHHHGYERGSSESIIAASC